MGLPTLTIEDARETVQVVHGTPDPAKLSLYTPVRNEMRLLPAFLAHYRAIGYEQFLISDDGSDDGSLAYLQGQGDVVVIRPDLAFGAPVLYRDPTGKTRQDRAGTVYKIALPHAFCPGKYVSYFDADEYLFLPPGVSSVKTIIAQLEKEGATSAVTSLVEFFPADASGLQGDFPQSFGALLNAYPYFEPAPLVRLHPDDQPELVGATKTAQLFERYGIKPRSERRGWHRLYMPSRVKKEQGFQKSPRHKTPIVLRTAQSYLVGSHNANLAPSPNILLCTAHFVFTAQFADKIARATAWGAHANGAAKYRYYAELLAAMEGVDAGFLSRQSAVFEGVGQLIECELMKW